MIITITGKSGSGKTYLANKIAPFFNAKIISFDEISHNVLTDKQVLNKIEQYFGKSVFDNEKLNRKKLGNIVFNNTENLNLLNNLCQSKIEDEVDKIIKDNKAEILILEYALLPNMKYFNMSNCNILIKASHNLRKTRIVNRDKISDEYFLMRENNSLEYDESKFDIIIENELNLNVEQISQQIKEILCSEKQ